MPGVTVSDQPAPGTPWEAQPPREAASHQVVVGDIPVEPPGFRPRPGLLAELDRAGTRVSVIHAGAGLRGLGATQLAAAYARAKLEADWQLVAWVNGADISSLLAGMAAVADVAGLTGDDSSQGFSDAGAMVRRWLEADGDRCLLVFDDVSDPEAVRAFVPAHGRARVLITSTRRSAASLGSAVSVDVFSAAEASAFLTGRTGLDDEAGAAAVAAALGHLPLALALAAPVIAAPHVGYERYLGRLQGTPDGVPLTAEEGQPYPPSFRRTVLLSLQAVRAADRTGACTRVMEIMSVLSPAGVRRELLYAAGQAGVLASGRHRVAAGPVDRVLEWLHARSLLAVSLDGQTVTMHPLVTRVIRDELDRRRTVPTVCETAAFVLDVYSRALNGSPDRRAVRGIPQQVTALLDSLAGSVTEVDEELAWLLLRLRFAAFYHLLELGDSTPQAIAVGEPLARDLERLLGPDHPDTLNSRNSLAAAYLAAGRVAEAIPLFEQAVAVRQNTLGPDDPETLTSQNNLASAYQDAGRTAEAIRLYELTLEARERLLGPDHPSTMNSRGNLAAAYQDAGQAVEAIPLLEQTLADRERVLGPDHPDVQSSRKNLAKAYQDAGRGAEAIPLLERTSPDRKRVLRSDHPEARIAPGADLAPGRAADTIPPAGPTRADAKTQPLDRAAGQMLPASFRRPPADPARRVLPAGLRRPPADPVRRPLPSGAGRPPAKQPDLAISGMEDLPDDVHDDAEIVGAVTAEDPAGMAMAYDKYAASLYGYCHWMLHDSADAAEALKNTFVIAAATISDLAEPAKLRPWLFALARSECRRRIRPASAARDEETDAVEEPSDEEDEPFGGLDQPSDAMGQPSDATVTFRAISPLPRTAGAPSDATVTFRAITPTPHAAAGPSDATVTFRAINPPHHATREASDATVSFQVVSLPTDATMPFRVVGHPADGLAQGHGDQGEAALRTLIYAILAGLKPREREVIELSFRHDLHDEDLAIALGASWSRAHVLAARARRQLEEALGALHIALTRREACPVLGELLADWDGQLTEDTRDLVIWHIGECQTCAHHGWGALRPAAFSRLLPLAPLPAELREQVLSCCTSTAEDAVAYRWRAVRRAESVWLTRLWPAVRHVSWAGIRAHPGPAIVFAAVGMWVAAVVSVALIAFGGSHPAYAQPTHPPTAPASPAQTSGGTSPGSPAVVRPTARTSRSARPSPKVTRPVIYVSHPAQSSPSPTASRSPSPSPSPSKSPSSSPSPSKSPSPSPSHTTSPSSSPSPTA
jgi:RNA polymerase sigma factor (sigma-70 family)